MLIPELGLYHYRARTYSAYLGRFLQADPAGTADGFNLYAYVGNDPINATDPSGMAAVYCQPNFTFQSVFGVDYSGIGTSDGQLKCEYTGGGDTGGDLPRMDNITVRSSKDALPGVAYTSPVFVTDVHNFNINITSGTPGGSAGNNNKPDDCAYRNAAGMCVYVRNKNGKLQFAPDYQEQVCASFNSLQDGATKTNDGLTAVGLVAGTRGGSVGTIVGGLSTFGAFISSLTTGAGFRPFGFTIIPKSAPPPGC